MNRRLASARQTVAVVLVALAAASVLNADALYQTATVQPFGWRRDAAMALASPLRTAVRTAKLHTPRTAFEAVVAFDFGRPDALSSRAIALGSADGVAAASAGLGRRGRVPTMYIAGDSVSAELGAALRTAAARREVAATAEHKLQSGLARPEVFDWPRHISERTSRLDPQAVVLMFGANDNTDIRVGGRRLRFRTAAWRAEYESRVAALVDQVLSEGREVYWIGEPRMRNAVISESLAFVNDVARNVADARPGVTYIDSWALLSDDQGRYAAYLPAAGGRLVKVRDDDGIHLTPSGGERLARAVLEAMAARRPAPQRAPEAAPAPAPAPQPSAEPAASPTPAPQPTPAPDGRPDPTAEPQRPRPTPRPTPEPTEAPTPAPTPRPTPSPSPPRLPVG